MLFGAPTSERQDGHPSATLLNDAWWCVPADNQPATPCSIYRPNDCSQGPIARLLSRIEMMTTKLVALARMCTWGIWTVSRWAFCLGCCVQGHVTLKMRDVGPCWLMRPEDAVWEIHFYCEISDDGTPLGPAICVPTWQKSPPTRGPVLEVYMMSEHRQILTVDL